MNASLEHLASAIGVGLLQFTWIVCLIGLVLAVVLFVLNRRLPPLRYGVALAGFIVLAAVPLATIGAKLYQINSPKKTLAKATASGPTHDLSADVVLSAKASETRYRPDLAPLSGSPWTPDAMVWIPDFRRLGYAIMTETKIGVARIAPWLAAAWVAGVLFLALRLLGGAHYTRALRIRGTSSLDAAWQVRLDQLRTSAGIRRGVQVLQSTASTVPLVVGAIRPVILMPAAVFTGLTTRQVELLLAHELAHIKRLDPLVNLFQAVVETLLLFHPVVWWLSRRIREERELCCDDFALGCCGGRAEYAQALLHLAEATLSMPQLALSSQGSPLRRRINRILGVSQPARRLNAPGLLVLTIAALLCTVASGVVWVERNAEPVAATTNAPIAAFAVQAPLVTSGLPSRTARPDSSNALYLPDERIDAPSDESVASTTIPTSTEGTSIPESTADASPESTPLDATDAPMPGAMDSGAIPDRAVNGAGPLESEAPDTVLAAAEPSNESAAVDVENSTESEAIDIADSATGTDVPMENSWPDLAEMRISDQIASEHISDVLDRWGKEFHVYFHLDPSIVMAPEVTATQDLYQTDGLVVSQRFDEMPLDQALPQLLEPLGLTYWYSAPKAAEGYAIYPSVWINTSANLEPIQNSDIPYFQFHAAVATLSAEAREACMDRFAPQIGNEQGKILRFEGEASAMGNATPDALLALLDEYEAAEIRQNARVIAAASDRWWPLSVRSVLVGGSTADVTGKQSGEGAADSGPSGGCLFPHRFAENMTWNPFTDGTCGNKISTPPSIRVNCDDALLPFGQEWMAACASPSVVVCMDQIYDPPLVAHTNVPSKRAGRRGAHLPRPDPPSPENPADVTLYHEGTLLGLGAIQREDFIQVQFFGQYRLRGQGAVPWQAILTRYATRQGDIMGFFLPADDRDDCLLVLLRVETYTPA